MLGRPMEVSGQKNPNKSIDSIFNQQLLQQTMTGINKGSYLIRQIIKRIENESNNNEQEEQESATTPNHSVSLVQGNKNFVLQKKEKSIYKRLMKLSPTIPMNHINRVFGFIGINQKAIREPGYEESFFYTYFQDRVIEKVEFYEHAIVLELSLANFHSGAPNTEYLIERYKSQGDASFYDLAVLIEETTEALKSMKEPPPEQKSQSVKKWLDFLGDSMFTCTLGMRKVAISKSLLTYLQYDLQEFAIQAVKYRCLFHEFFSSISYKAGICHCIRNIKNTVLLSQGKISLSQYREMTTYRFTDFIYSKNHIKSFCDMTFSLLNPTFFCHKINFIYYKGEQPEKRLTCEPLQLALQDEKDKIQQGEYRAIKKIKNIPHILLKQNHRLVASYKTTREETQDDCLSNSEEKEMKNEEQQ